MAIGNHTGGSIRRVLVIFPGALGDFVCLMPSIAAIATRHREASIELMARADLARFAVGRTVVARGHSIDSREVSAMFTDGTESVERARDLFGGFDRIYSFFASDDVRYRSRLAAATRAETSFHPFRPASGGHVATAFLSSIGASDAPLVARIEATPEDLAGARRLLTGSGIDLTEMGVRLTAIFPGSGSPAKNWPANRFAALARMLSEHSRVAIIAGPAEASIEPAFRDCGVPVLRGLDLGVVAGIARRSSSFVGNDSGVSHLSAAVGTPGVVIFGNSDPERWHPLGKVTVLRRDPIESLEPEEVAAALHGLHHE